MAKTQRPKRQTRATRDPFELLDKIAHNAWWSWNPEAMALFEYANPSAFSASNHNPIVAMRKLTAARRRQLVVDAEFVAEVGSVHLRLRDYLDGETWYGRTHGKKKVSGSFLPPPAPERSGKIILTPFSAIAYFCMEYGLHESLPLYAGGLGVLAGDHLKSASDLGLPLVAVGIYWRHGYTRQSIDKNGCQQDRFPLLPVADTPLREVTTAGATGSLPARAYTGGRTAGGTVRTGRGRPVRIKLPMGGRTVVARAWRLDVGRVPLFLLDTDLPENSRQDRRLVDVLYSGDRDMRIRQEILLGIGGWRLLQAINVIPAACHLNEGHAAFLTLERIAERITAGESFRRAVQQVTNTTVFTTHTPVPAGNEQFDPALVDRYLGHYTGAMGISHTVFHDLARVKPGNTAEPFGMTPLALRTSRYCNGVAALHGAVAREMWKPLYPGVPIKRVPIGHVTNGIHLRTWLHAEMGMLLDDVLGEGWEDRQDLARTWKPIAGIPDDVLWDLHMSFKDDLAELCAGQGVQTGSRGQGRSTNGHIFDPEALTIGFARRFAGYKRAALIFSQPGRLARILNHARRPVQLIFAGKAHPADTPGKDLIQQVVKYARDPRFGGRVWFLEDYEMGIARRLTAGVDVWLNNPQRPREASGTSGMKPALHGGLNFSILDGWWPEGFNGKNGWAIGKGENYDGTRAADRRDAASLYQVLERQIVPMYYDRDADGLPRRWIACMKNAITTIPPVFNSHRQVKEYLSKYYLPAMRKAQQRR